VSKSASRRAGGVRNSRRLAAQPQKSPEIENARDRSPWRLNLDGRVVQPVLRPSAPPQVNLQLSLPLLPLAAPASNLHLAAAALLPARPWANPPARIGVFPLGSTGGKHPAFTVCYALPTDWRLTFQLALVSVLQLGLRLLPLHIWRRPSARLVSNLRLSPSVVATFSLRCLLLRPSACAVCRPSATPAANLRLASAVPRPALPVSLYPACAEHRYLRLGL
jgi:hypothetical protein